MPLIFVGSYFIILIQRLKTFVKIITSKINPLVVLTFFLLPFLSPLSHSHGWKVVLCRLWFDVSLFYKIKKLVWKLFQDILRQSRPTYDIASLSNVVTERDKLRVTRTL